MMKLKKMIGLGLASLICITSLSALARGKGYTSYGPEEMRFGAGLYLGEPTGFTFKGYVTEKLAIDGIAGWGLNHKVFTMIGDVTYDFLDIPIDSTVVKLPLYAGIGTKLEFKVGPNDDTTVGLRAPIGIAVQWLHHPFEVFAEIAPGMKVSPSAGFDIMGGVGVRFYF
ncbi:MAG: hypothetical protein Q7T03_10295 [Deltaproteobacteria bacterium]|nr:hypothetical protein [Deltaproteobacteria bacterium]